MTPSIRPATAADLDAIFRIYNHEVLHGTATFDTEPIEGARQTAWLRAHEDPRHPALVAVGEGRVVGWGSLSAWSDRCAYARAVEVSVYVDSTARGRGVGRALIDELAVRGRAAGVAVLLARIASESTASLRLFERLGFQRIGTMRRVGEKLGRVLDVELYDRHLDLEEPDR